MLAPEPRDRLFDNDAKANCRSTVISHAIKCLTTERSTSACVQRDHVRQVWKQLRESGERQAFFPDPKEIDSIEAEISQWEHLHDAKIATKKASDLTVCYLGGKDPTKDLEVLVKNGVLPQNIWIVEKNLKTCEKAWKAISCSNLKNVRFFKNDILHFFTEVKRNHDIIYFDACGPLPAVGQNTLKVIGYVFQYAKLNSPGALITNFSFPPKTEPTKCDEKAKDTEAIIWERKEMRKFVTEYLEYRMGNTWMNESFLDNIGDFLDKRTDEENYSDYITYQVIDSAYLYIPALRMLSSTSPLWNQIFKEKKHFLNLLKQCKTMFDGVTNSSASTASASTASASTASASTASASTASASTASASTASASTASASTASASTASASTASASTASASTASASTASASTASASTASASTASASTASASTASASNARDDVQLSILKGISIDSPLRNCGSAMEDKLNHNAYAKAWVTEILPHWQTSTLKNQKLQFLLLTHLLSYYDYFISKFTNVAFQKHCIEPLFKALCQAGYPKFYSPVDLSNTTNLIAGLLYGQMAYPSFPVVDKMLRLRYTGNKRQMFTDVFIFDQCRYVYDQFPSTDYACFAIIELKQQMVFRMVVDGLRKHLEDICYLDVFPDCHVASIEPVTTEGTGFPNSKPRIPKRKKVK
ncbi:uncharacterized protein [Pocillopora verrucosa]